MKTGLILVGIGFLMIYATMQIWPLINGLREVSKEDLKDLELSDWLLAPFVLFIMLFPLLGMIFCLPLHDKGYEKLSLSITGIGLWLAVIGLIVVVATV